MIVKTTTEAVRRFYKVAYIKWVGFNLQSSGAESVFQVNAIATNKWLAADAVRRFVGLPIEITGIQEIGPVDVEGA